MPLCVSLDITYTIQCQNLVVDITANNTKKSVYNVILPFQSNTKNTFLFYLNPFYFQVMAT